MKIYKLIFIILLLKSLSIVKAFFKNKEDHQKDQLKKILILGKIGFGSFGDIFHAANYDNPNEQFAIKVVPKKKNLLKQIKIETEVNELLAKLNNFKYVVKFYKKFENENFYYFIMELMEIDFFDALNLISTDTQIGFVQKINYLKQLAEGIKYLHSADVFHRDIKLENLMLTKEGDLKLGDFGLSEVNSTADIEYIDELGSENYIPIEMSFSKYYTRKADIWSLGIIAYALFYGDFPDFHTHGNLINFKKLEKIKKEADEDLADMIKVEEISFFKSIFVFERDRMSIERVLEILNEILLKKNMNFKKIVYERKNLNNFNHEEIKVFFPKAKEYKNDWAVIEWIRKKLSFKTIWEVSLDE